MKIGDKVRVNGNETLYKGKLIVKLCFIIYYRFQIKL